MTLQKRPRVLNSAAVTMLGGAGLLLAACGGTGSSSPAGGSGGAAAAYTLPPANVSGLGTALVNGSGQTFYTLRSEAGGKLTCTDANGCTKVWPDIELPAGAQADRRCRQATDSTW